ncbi:MAG: rod shape-determining protein MreD [Bacillota bacterium]
MKKVLIYAIFLLALTLLQTNFVQGIAIFDVKPNLLIAFIIVVGLTNGSRIGAVVGFISGLIMDSYSSSPVGIYMLLGMLLGMLSGATNKNFFRDNYILTIVFAFVYTMLFETVAYFFVLAPISWSDGIGSVLINLFVSYKNFILIEAVYAIPFACALHFLSFKFLVGLNKEGRRMKYRRGY